MLFSRVQYVVSLENEIVLRKLDTTIHVVENKVIRARFEQDWNTLHSQDDEEIDIVKDRKR